MTSTPTHKIRIAGLLDPSWSEWLEGLAIQHAADGITILAGTLRDQAALHGVLNKIRDLGLTLLSVQTTEGPYDE